LRPPLELVLGELFGQWQMPPRKRKVPEPLAVGIEALIGGVVAVRGGGVYDEAKRALPLQRAAL